MFYLGIVEQYPSLTIIVNMKPLWHLDILNIYNVGYEPLLFPIIAELSVAYRLSIPGVDIFKELGTD
jgi:hypothetical protein